MKIDVTTEQKTVIIGGGIAGLASAWYLQKAGIDYVLLEGSDRFGGLINTHHEDDSVIEMGPDAFITRKPWAMDLVRDLNLQNDLISVNETPERIYILSDGDLVPLPDGLRLLVPTNVPAFLASPLLSWAGKLRVLMDNFIPAKSNSTDESLADFVTRRMGSEALEKLADPLLAGVYNAEMNKQSILATFPQYSALEQQYGSLIRGMSETLKHKTPSSVPALVSFKRGMSQLVDTLVEKLTGDLHLNVPASKIEDSYKVSLADGTVLEADNIIIATSAKVASQLLENIAPDSAQILGEIRYAGIGSMSLLYDVDDIPRALDAYGVVIPSSAGRMIDGMQWSSSKWQSRALDDKALIRVFFGGPHTREMQDKSDSELMAIVREELRAILGVTAKPQLTHLSRWHNAYPQYDVGHIERVANIEQSLPANIALAGNTYYGVGIPDTIHSAQKAVEKIQQTIIL